MGNYLLSRHAQIKSCTTLVAKGIFKRKYKYVEKNSNSLKFGKLVENWKRKNFLFHIFRNFEK